jgi:hypothetical protein
VSGFFWYANVRSLVESDREVAVVPGRRWTRDRCHHCRSVMDRARVRGRGVGHGMGNGIGTGAMSVDLGVVDVVDRVSRNGSVRGDKTPGRAPSRVPNWENVDMVIGQLREAISRLAGPPPNRPSRATSTGRIRDFRTPETRSRPDKGQPRQWVRGLVAATYHKSKHRLNQLNLGL